MSCKYYVIEPNCITIVVIMIIVIIIKFIEKWKECTVGWLQLDHKEKYFCTLHYQHTFTLFIFKPKGNRLANQAIVGITYGKTREKSIISNK